jgi:hypothetical protein
MIAETISFHVNSKNDEQLASRSQICQQVVEYFGEHYEFPITSTVRCLIDDQDFLPAKANGNKANRGYFVRIEGEHLCQRLPDYLWPQVAETDPWGDVTKRFYDAFVYLHNSTCETGIGLTLTLAHELQHFVQYATKRSIWAANGLLMCLPQFEKDFKVWWALPIEKDARIVAKRVAEELHGSEAVDQHIIRKIEERVTDADAEDWNFVRSISPSLIYDIGPDTKSLVRKYKVDLVQVQHEEREDPDLGALDLDSEEWL